MLVPISNLVNSSFSRLALLSVSLVTLSACSLFGDRSGEYVNADPGQALELPESMNQAGLRSRFPIPAIENNRPLPVDFELPKPPDATAAIIADDYLVESFGSETWLQLFSSPSEVWPLIELYWQEYDIDLERKDTSKGFQVTVALTDSTANQAFIKTLEAVDSKVLLVPGMSFQLSVRHGVRRSTSEIQVRALLPSSYVESDQYTWQLARVNPRLERALLKSLGDFVTSDLVSSRHSFMANEIGGESRIRLVESAVTGSQLEMDLSLARAKNEIEQAMSSAGVIISTEGIEAENNDSQIFVSYIDSDELESWYHTESMLEERRAEKNILLKLVEQEPGSVVVTAELLNPDFEPSLVNELLAIIYEHTS